MKKVAILLLILVPQLMHAQTDSIKVVRNSVDVEVHCRFKKENNKFYYEKIGETFQYYDLANGWFKMEGSCPMETYLYEMGESKFYLNSVDSYMMYKKGKPHSGRVRESDGDYILIGRCKKGKLHGKVKILDNSKKIVWQGEFNKSNFIKD